MATTPCSSGCCSAATCKGPGSRCARPGMHRDGKVRRAGMLLVCFPGEVPKARRPGIFPAGGLRRVKVPALAALGRECTEMGRSVGPTCCEFCFPGEVPKARRPGIFPAGGLRRVKVPALAALGRERTEMGRSVGPACCGFASQAKCRRHEGPGSFPFGGISVAECPGFCAERRLTQSPPAGCRATAPGTSAARSRRPWARRSSRRP
jgi:hypothetical protein